MKKLVAVLFGLLVVTAGFAAATQWRVTSVHQRHAGRYGWAYAEVHVKYDLQHPYTNYKITHRIGRGGLTSAGRSAGYISHHYNIPDRDGIESVTNVVDPTTDNLVEQDIASAGWLCI
ncbi:hypothetical protein TK0321 [Thermococcus kodakarensis KOD1]|uniref:Uncharacterized protein n=1 Tax=Thermococcus kodakarensis (strain ATCC BAA-918 / JCM 12380 / KOD1) TaxID=69014 RepID=Q5JG11_THEKO|nr:hypothetical protein [Thermococcus kodakarensis]WCN28398.1 hypothetical protein POG15_01635 [Thermococcus kodakarensis]WCN30694.1 hypothetical protein POG21_01635 [Thermococcus kodakarensis]BAD84510.1 hypothetical protein TK0321 [Thermococcus kodakarensis KOD1]